MTVLATEGRRDIEDALSALEGARPSPGAVEKASATASALAKRSDFLISWMKGAGVCSQGKLSVLKPCGM
jgi:hypothetical protein